MNNSNSQITQVGKKTKSRKKLYISLGLGAVAIGATVATVVSVKSCSKKTAAPVKVADYAIAWVKDANGATTAEITLTDGVVPYAKFQEMYQRIREKTLSVGGDIPVTFIVHEKRHSIDIDEYYFIKGDFAGDEMSAIQYGIEAVAELRQRFDFNK